ncbi:hypothetical protein NKR23_g10392 [Pleurostoma richardsiae]|uniref:N-acetyltransferase domain-containing protein n=1 Tax=Pleurostoma richardsiae TaxID=41990 RepID=A0AA38VIL5_9PEZI|nr:hypothetical protein NKR23_g10392 [Pleurostoma richardsiae]
MGEQQKQSMPVVRIRQAEPRDVDQVTDVLIAAMSVDQDWWDYRYPYRLAHPDDHRRFLRLLVESWIRLDFDDWLVVVAECADEAEEAEGTGPVTGQHWRIVAYAAWDVSYGNFRRYGEGYHPQNPSQVVQDAGGQDRRDANPAHAARHSEAAVEGHREHLDSLFGTEQLHLQGLGTHPDFQRRGLAASLCRWGMDRAAEDGVALTVMAAPLARGVYPRMGFRELEQVLVQVPGEEERTFLYPMVWEPSRPAE